MYHIKQLKSSNSHCTVELSVVKLIGYNLHILIYKIEINTIDMVLLLDKLANLNNAGYPPISLTINNLIISSCYALYF